MSDSDSDLGQLQVIDLDAGEVFSGQTSGRLIKGFAAPCSHTPAVDPNYLFHDAMRELVVWIMNPSDPLYVFGPTGAGKSSLIRQVAAKLNYPVFDITGHGRLEFNDLAGHLTVENGSMRFQYGPLALAMKFGGLFLLNELDLLDPATAAGLNGVLDGAPLCLPENGGEVIPPHPMFRFVATANTNGASDDTGLYQGTLRQNLAFMDRFWLCEVGYPEPEAEAKLLERLAPALPESLRHTMVEYANQVRRLFVGEGDNQQPGETIEVTFSTRTSDLPHYHIILLVNGSVIQNPMGIFQKAEQIWNRITGVSYRGLIHFCDYDQENGSVMIRRPTKVAGGEELAYQQQIFSAAYAEALRRGSYLAKTHTKDIPPPHRGRRFGGSQL